MDQFIPPHESSSTSLRLEASPKHRYVRIMVMQDGTSSSPGRLSVPPGVSLTVLLTSVSLSPTDSGDESLVEAALSESEAFWLSKESSTPVIEGNFS